MEKIVSNLKKEMNEISKLIDNASFFQLKKSILNEILSTLLSGKSYQDINNELEFLEDNLEIIYSKEDAKKYSETIKIILIALIKCSNSKKVLKEDENKFALQMDRMISLLRKEYDLANKTFHEQNITHNRNMLAKIKRILKYIESESTINENMAKEIYDLLVELGYSKEESIIFIEKVKLKNNVSMQKKTCKNVIEIIKEKLPFVKEDLIDYENRSKVNNLFQEYSSRINDNTPFEEFMLIINEIENIPNNKIRDGVLYRVLSRISHEYSENKALLLDDEFYFADDFRNEILENCNNLHKRYNYVLTIYKKEDVDVKRNDKYNVKMLFGETLSNTYFESDLKDLNHEIYDGVNNLLRDINSGSEIVILKKLSGFDNLYEFKYDKLNNQIRFICRQITNGIYVNIGIMQKKTQAGDKLYKKFDKRMDKDDFQMEKLLCEYDNVLNRINEYINTNSRRGTRK